MPEIVFRTPTGTTWAPEPRKAADVLPDWFKQMVKRVPQVDGEFPHSTARRCMPFTDALVAGYVITLPQQVHVVGKPDGQVIMTWQPREQAAIERHGFEQLPLDEITGGVFKFVTPWAAVLPEGYSALYTHPLNRVDLPFVSFSGIVDDGYDSPVNIPFMWIAGEGETILDAGTPIAQIIPFKREEWVHYVESVSAEEHRRDGDQATVFIEGYRRQFRKLKVWR